MTRQPRVFISRTTAGLAALAERVTELPKDGRNTFGTSSHWDQPADPARDLKQCGQQV